MSLAGKYLKYSPEITLEIFTLICNKLIECGINPNHKESIETKYNYFSGAENYLQLRGDGKCFDCYKEDYGLIETTVQEILGYDPFVKDFVLPEKWYVPVTDETAKDINIFKSKTRWYEDAIGYKAVGYEGVGYNSLPNDYIEITFEQFKKYVLKESIETPKVVIPEYVELLEGFDNTCTGKIFDTNQPIPQMSGWSNQWTWESIFKNNIQRPYFKPSTREAFDAQNQPKSIEKWSVGSYGVVINSTNKRFPIGFIDKIIPATTHKKVEFENYNSYDPGNLEYSYGLEFKWFATKSEAEEFAKTLVEPVKEVIQLTTFPIEGYCKTDNVELRRYLTRRPNTTLSEEPKWIEGKSIGVGWNERSHWIISEKSSKPEYQLNQLERFFNKEEVKQPLKQAVHCKTQEEWDFVISKISKKDSAISKLLFNNKRGCININGISQAPLEFYLQNNYQILSFQEWCDLNGYKMEKEVKFEVGQLVWISSKPMNGNGMNLSGKDDGVYRLMDLDSPEFATGHLLENSHFKFKCGKNYFKTNIKNIRHATPEEINNYLVSIGQIPDYPIRDRSTDDLSNYGLPTEPPSYMYEMRLEHSVSNPKLILSIDDEELSMVSVIKTNSIKQLLNIE